jgi:hypothetical protein
MCRLSGKYSARFCFLMFAALCISRLVTVALMGLACRSASLQHCHLRASGSSELKGPACLVVGACRAYSGHFDLSARELLAFALAGMLRGNVSWAQALQLRHLEHEIASTVLIVVLLSMFVFELVLPVVMRSLISHARQEDHKGERERQDSSEALLTEHVGDGAEEPEQEAGDDRGSLLYRVTLGSFREWDMRYVQPYFSGGDQVLPNGKAQDGARESTDSDASYAPLYGEPVHPKSPI